MVTFKKRVSLTESDPERSLEFEFVRATENAALNADVHKVLEGIDALAAPADAAARTANTPSSSMPSEQLASDGEQAPREQTSNVQAMLASYAQNTRVH